MKYIALDASSTTIGWAVGEVRPNNQAQHLFSGTYPLNGQIGTRVKTAYEFTRDLIATWRPAQLAIESPASHFPGGGIPQLRVSGAIILACEQAGVLWREYAPTSTKLTLAGSGRATKLEMVQAAAPYLGFKVEDLVFKATKASARAYLGGVKVYDDNEADGVALLLHGIKHMEN